MCARRIPSISTKDCFTMKLFHDVPILYTYPVFSVQKIRVLQPKELNQRSSRHHDIYKEMTQIDSDKLMLDISQFNTKLIRKLCLIEGDPVTIASFNNEVPFAKHKQSNLLLSLCVLY